MKISPYLIDEGYVNRIKHPTEELYLYNYSPKSQFEGINSPAWKDYPELQWCRGLILNDKDEIVARPFPKFWNIESYENNGLPAYSTFEIFDKMDGSLGIVYHTSKGLAVATRGSFQSEQAIWATKFLNERYPKFAEEYKLVGHSCTFLFEIIYPENRIVVDYKGDRNLVLLSIIDKFSGVDYSRAIIEHNSKIYGFPIVDKFDGITDFAKVRDLLPRDNAEGFVVLFDTGLRVKMKYEEYCRLHKLVTGVSSKKIWEILRAGQDIKEIIDMVPDEFYQWVMKVKTELDEKYKSIDIQVLLACEQLIKIEDIEEGIDRKEIRKRQASVIFKNWRPLSSAIFASLDGKDYKGIIWSMCEPKYEQPFKTGVE